jgi:hypothetical protein
MITIWERFKVASRSLLHYIEWTYSQINPPPYPRIPRHHDLSYRSWEPHLDHSMDDPGSTSEEMRNDNVREVSKVG